MGTGQGQPGRLQQRFSAAYAWIGRHPALTDLAVPLVLVPLSTGPAARGSAGDAPWWWLAAAGCLLPLAWRRRHPAIVFAMVTAAAAAITAAAFRPLVPTAVAALLVALYTVASRQPLSRALIAAGVFEAWGVPTLVRWSPADATLPGAVLLTGTAAAAVVAGVHMQTRRAYLAALEDRAARLELERDQQAQLAVATERARIAREVHDIVTHSLSVMVALADGAAVAAGTAPDRAGAAMRQVASTGRQAIGEMRRSVGTLRVEDGGRHPAPGLDDLEDLLSQVRAAGLPARLIVEGQTRELTPGIQLAVYRIIQEALTNVRKHAHAPTGAVVRLRYYGERIDVQITDDGQVHAGSLPGSGYGIAGMRERAAAYGGTVEAGPGAHGGWRVQARLAAGQDEEP